MGAAAAVEDGAGSGLRLPLRTQHWARMAAGAQLGRSSHKEVLTSDRGRGYMGAGALAACLRLI